MKGASLRYLVAGGGGFIGSHLVDTLIDAGHSVVVVDNFLTGQAVNLRHLEGFDQFRLVRADISEPLPEEATAEPYDRVYHLASPASPVGYRRFPLETLEVNSTGTRRLLDLAKRDNARFLFASTSEAYGDPLVHPQPETYWGNVNPIGWRSCYDEGKRFAESLTVTFGDVHGLDVRIARIFNTYGPRSALNDGRVIPNFCVQALRGLPITIYGTGDQTRSLCYVDDLVKGLHLLMEIDGLSGEVVNLGNPQEVTVLQIAEVIRELAESDSPLEHRPLPQDDPARRKPDIAKAIRLLDWSPAVELTLGMTRTLAYFRDELTKAGEIGVPPAGSHQASDLIANLGTRQ